MGLTISIPQKVISYTDQQYELWKNGDRSECTDPYCSRLPGTYGFGEFLVGRYYAEQGYQWIHHDYNIFGGNNLGKYPRGDEVLSNYFSRDRFMMLRTINKHFKRFQEPDLMIFKPDYSELRFAECKRNDTRDKLDIEQVRGLAIIAALLQCEVEVFLITKQPISNPEPLIFQLPLHLDTLRRPARIEAINKLIQNQLAKNDLYEVTAIDAAIWLEQAGLLNDSKSRPGLPLRKLLREGAIDGQYQADNGRWYIRRRNC